MSVCIKGMEMPDKCGHCRFANAFDCTVTGSFISTYNIRQPDCPLVPVPEHGRLIDADALHEELRALEYVRENEWLDGVREARGVDAARVALLDAPTIIPADKEVRKK